MSASANARWSARAETCPSAVSGSPGRALRLVGAVDAHADEDFTLRMTTEHSVHPRRRAAVPLARFAAEERDGLIRIAARMRATGRFPFAPVDEAAASERVWYASTLLGLVPAARERVRIAAALLAFPTSALWRAREYRVAFVVSDELGQHPSFVGRSIRGHFTCSTQTITLRRDALWARVVAHEMVHALDFLACIPTAGHFRWGENVPAILTEIAAGRSPTPYASLSPSEWCAEYLRAFVGVGGEGFRSATAASRMRAEYPAVARYFSRLIAYHEHRFAKHRKVEAEILGLITEFRAAKDLAA